MKINRPKNRKNSLSQTMIIRSIASSTAIETGQSIQNIEEKLKKGSQKFQHLTLGPSR